MERPAPDIARKLTVQRELLLVGEWLAFYRRLGDAVDDPVPLGKRLIADSADPPGTPPAQ